MTPEEKAELAITHIQRAIEILENGLKGKFASEKFLKEHRVSFDVSPNVPRWKRNLKKDLQNDDGLTGRPE